METSLKDDPSPSRGGRDQPPQILAVDDNPANLAALEAALGDLGGRFIAATSGRDALRLLLEQEFAVILLDVKMPVMGGFETARIIRQRERTRHLPIIFLTAYERDDEEVEQAYSLGAVDFLFKPLVAEVLCAKVAVFLELQQRTLEVERQNEKLREMERSRQEAHLAEERRTWDNERLREEAQRKDEFLAMLAHELRNPLAPIVTGVEILKRMGLDDHARPICESMERQLHHLIRLVDDLLDISRISSGKIEIHREPFQLADAVRQALESVRPGIDQREQVLVEDLSDESMTGLGDYSRLIQLVSNLLTNANRYTPAGGRIEVRLRREGDEAVLSVADEGRGIRPEMLERIFDMFVQERLDGKGLGLGLTLVRRIAELHGGRVAVTSEGIGKGACFTVTLPLAGEELEGDESGEGDEVAVQLAAQGSEASESEPLSIVVIEDEEDVRESTRLLLESWGHEVHTAASGPEGIEAVRQLRPAVALVDIGMPAMDGYAVARHLCQDSEKERPYLVAVTGFGQEHDRRKSKRAGFDSHLVKPATAEGLLQVLLEARAWRE